MRLILKEGVTQDQIDEAMLGAGSRLINVIPASEQNPMMFVYSSPDRAASLFVVEDARLGVCYLTGQGEGLRGHLEQLARALPHLPSDEIERRLSSPADPLTWARGLGALVLASAGAPTETQLGHLRRALCHAEPLIRSAALVSLSYVLWEELRGDVEELCAREQDSVLRLQATQVLELFAARGAGR